MGGFDDWIIVLFIVICWVGIYWNVGAETKRRGKMGVHEGATPYMNTKFTSTPVIDKQTFMRDYRDCMLRLGIPMSTVHANNCKHIVFHLLQIKYESGVQKYLETIQQMMRNK
jgi:hypothetical protein